MVETWVDCWAAELIILEPPMDEAMEYMDIRLLAAMAWGSGVIPPSGSGGQRRWFQSSNMENLCVLFFEGAASHGSGWYVSVPAGRELRRPVFVVGGRGRRGSGEIPASEGYVVRCGTGVSRTARGGGKGVT